MTEATILLTYLLKCTSCWACVDRWLNYCCTLKTEPYKVTVRNAYSLKPSFNPPHPNISLHILSTLLYTFPKGLTGRFFLKTKSCFSWWSFPPFSSTFILNSGIQAMKLRLIQVPIQLNFLLWQPNPES